MDDTNLTGVESLGEVGPNSADERWAAAITVCHHATDATDAAELLAMLGLTGSATRIADPCRGCGRPMSNLALIGHARRSSGGGGLCEGCQRTAAKVVNGR
ncbi:hypothetical protein [Nocardia sp. NPDC058633]|uniref:hypothetical protein n=1 Tax=Nocardia sp. NPDC058633 TaxID=3346568 RepID=UPI003661C280